MELGLELELESSVVGAIVEASLDREKLPAMLLLCGVLEAAGALWLLVYRGPGGVFLHGGKVVFYSYYTILVALVLFGCAEAWAGLWVNQRPCDRRAVGRTVLWCSILPLVLVAGLGAFASAIPK
ncbi:hypothetical protein CFC21_112087 [Triticum aestivum]|uniref:Uncharacterized protein n=2 Tax=Triticum aestivum TaxID=4565 RepID=A0A9R1MRB4_WHEAT|nr:hypothetical protein CFC21_112077 [Triticum aestivum]KAF7112140.1 hypothetical protein CFC21_112078 [Triticum aestivum]KAF7112141.1 hypothetical protein CFC21_112079 [Triticum aestivum]KAF7112142.1 hypothetical protein CFC21_112080 [Triticum aestivum]KAF7112149.1 hypothetical protein CFC21_112087 [Triticum aestivum]